MKHPTLRIDTRLLKIEDGQEKTVQWIMANMALWLYQMSKYAPDHEIETMRESGLWFVRED